MHWDCVYPAYTTFLLWPGQINPSFLQPNQDLWLLLQVRLFTGSSAFLRHLQRWEQLLQLLFALHTSLCSLWQRLSRPADTRDSSFLHEFGMLFSATASCIFRHQKMFHMWSQTSVQRTEMGLLVTKLFLLVVCIFCHLKNRISFNINTLSVLDIFVREKYIMKKKKKKSCHVLAAGAPFPHAASAVLAGQQELLDGLGLPPSCLTSLKAQRVPRRPQGAELWAALCGRRFCTDQKRNPGCQPAAYCTL